MKEARKKNRAPQARPKPLDEDSRDVALIRREIAKGGRTYSHSQVTKELGYHDLARPIHKRG